MAESLYPVDQSGSGSSQSGALQKTPTADAGIFILIFWRRAGGISWDLTLNSPEDLSEPMVSATGIPAADGIRCGRSWGNKTADAKTIAPAEP